MFDFKNASRAELNREYGRIAQEMGDDRFFTSKELNYLQKVLMECEQVLAFASGLMDGNTWLIVLTDKRIIFLDKGLVYGLKQVVIDLDRVNSVAGNTGLLFGKIMITDGARERKIENVWKKTVRPFTNKVQEAIEARKIYLSPMPMARANVIGSVSKVANLAAAGEDINDTKKDENGGATLIGMMALAVILYLVIHWLS